MLLRRLCALLPAVVLSCVPVSAALIVTLDEPVQVVAPGGGVAMFTGTILNTGPEVLSLGVQPTIVTDPAPPFILGYSPALAGFFPGPGESYVGPIMGVFVDDTAVSGDLYGGLLGLMGESASGQIVFSNELTFFVVVADVPEPGSALLLAIPILGFVAWRRRAYFFPVTR